MGLEKHKGENILLIGDFNSRNKIWGRNANNNSRMGLILEKKLLTLMTFTSQQTLITLTNNLQWQQWQKQH